MRNYFFAAISILFIFAIAQAQQFSVAYPENPVDGMQNPGYFSTIDGSMFEAFIANDSKSFDAKKFGGIFANNFAPFGFDISSYDIGNGDESITSFWWGLSLGGKAGGIGYLDKYYFSDGAHRHSWRVGLVSRMARWLSWGATYSEDCNIDSSYSPGNFNIDVMNRPLGQEIRTGLALRPNAEFLTIYGDAIFNRDFEYKSAIVGGEIMPYKGIHLRGSYDIENEQVSAGLRFDIGHFSLFGCNSNNDNNNISNAGVIISEKRFKSIIPYRAKSLKFTLAGSYSESPSLFGGKSFARLAGKISKIVDDTKVDELIIRLKNPSFTFAQYEELRNILQRFKNRGGKIKIFAEYLGNGTMYLTSVADEICLPPAGGVNFFGIGADITYYKKLFEKVGVKADMIHIGEYKTAAEPYVADSMSPQMREEITTMLQNIDTIIVNEIANGKNITADTVRGWIEKCPLQASSAREANIIDTVAYWDEFEKFSGWDKSKSINTYLFEHKEISYRWDSPPMIAIIPIEGSIVGGASNPGGFIAGRTAGDKTIVKLIEKAAKNPKVKGIILRIDSPGGSAYASDLIWHSADKASKKKPVWVSMGSYAASGGYYIASAGDSIFADLSTITGSIGVLGGKFTIGGLYDKLGLRKEQIYMSPNANIFSPTDTFSTKQRELMRKNMESSYTLFKNRIIQGRDNLSPDSLEKIAQGKVHTGKKALSIGLIDGIAGIVQVQNKFAKHLELGSDYKIRNYSPYESFDLFGLARKFTLTPEILKLKQDAELLGKIQNEDFWYLMPYYLELK
ncbi:signal peptide peptidase SppA [bacterium]|nr:signal peptide peptidase SppA [bacterium]